MDYIATLIFVVIVVFGGWFYSCKVNSWCGTVPDGVPLTEMLSAATQESPSSGDDLDAALTEAAEATDQKETEEKKDAAATSDTCEEYFAKDIRPGADNDKQEVIKLEKFLNEYEGEKLIAGGVYDGTDQAALKRFQEKYRADILDPAGIASPNGLVLAGTRAKLNELYCAQKK